MGPFEKFPCRVGEQVQSYQQVIISAVIETLEIFFSKIPVCWYIAPLGGFCYGREGWWKVLFRCFLL